MRTPRTKIVATIGPACWEEATLRALLLAGVSVARFNFSHAEHASTREKVRLVRRIADEEKLNVAVLADLQGPRIRVGELAPGGVTLSPGESVTLYTHEAVGDTEHPDTVIPVDYEGLARDVFAGDTILLDDGLISLGVEEVDPVSGRVRCVVRVGGTLLSHKGINVPERPLGVPALTEKDRADLRFALEQGADMVALSFVRSASDVHEGRKLIHSLTERPVPIIAKIEKRAAVDGFAEILGAADGVMVARGDLGVEMPPELLPAIQKRLITEANRVGKPVITATQMLDSMIRNPRPTRAEATDVANAVLDGADAIMLSGETASGKYPVEAAQTMARIALEAEKLFDYAGWPGRVSVNAQFGMRNAEAIEDSAIQMPHSAFRTASMRAVTEVICRAAGRISDELEVTAIITLTQSGTSARLVAKHRPRSTLIAITDRLSTQRALAITWGVRPLLIGVFGDSLQTLAEAEHAALDAGLVAPGDLLVLTGDLPKPLPGQTTMLKVQVAGETET
jgi:pyruvate kinase